MCATPLFGKISSLDHLFLSWNQFKRGKCKRKDIQCFERHLEDHVFKIQEDFKNSEYSHGPYEHFYVMDPKQRRISKATVRDRLVHQAVYSALSDLLDKQFIFHSLSSRPQKGIHLGIIHLQQMIRKVSGNGTRHCFCLKMDIKRFFDSIDHQILKTLIRRKIKDEMAIAIIDTIIDSFHIVEGKGIPLGNVTSQFFANLYLHELDNFIKHKLREPHYLRYCDDFILVSNDESHLKCVISYVKEFLADVLKLELHPRKIILRKLSKGIDFIGYVLFAKHILVRPTTKRRMKKRLKKSFSKYEIGKVSPFSMDQKLQSYLGILSHANEYLLSKSIKESYSVRSIF